MREGFHISTKGGENMICKGCGVKIPDEFLKGDRFRCPNCGIPYVRRTQKPADAGKARKPERFPAVALCLIAAALICAAGTLIVFHAQAPAPAISILEVTAVPTATAKPSPTPAPTDAAAALWAETFAETKGAALEAAQAIFSQFTLKSDIRVGSSPNLTDVYEISTDILLPAGTMRFVKSAIRYIEQKARACPYALDFSLVFLADEGAVCVAMFGASQSGYIISGGGSNAAYSAIDAIPDQIVHIAGASKHVSL